MADDNKDQEKTEEPTARKLEKAREEGNVSKSAEINSVVLMTIAVIVLYMSSGFIGNETVLLFETFYDLADQPVDNVANALEYLTLATIHGLVMIAPLTIVLFVMAILTNLVQVGVVFSTKVLEFKPERLDPVKGFGRIFSMRGTVELIKGLFKIFIVGMVIYYTVRNNVESFMSLAVMPLQTIIRESVGWVVLITTRILSALLLLAIADALYQRYKYRKDLRMSKQEVKDEYKQMEGDPLVKSFRKRQALKLSRGRRLDHAVLNSDVVITNPTHYAVALRYDPDKLDAPIVMAKGMRLRALKIREYAERYEIPIIENPPVARALYASAEEEQAIPSTLYQAVAEILAYVYKNKKQKAA